MIRVVIIGESLHTLLDDAPSIEVVGAFSHWSQYTGLNPDAILAEWDGDTPSELFEPALVLLAEDPTEALRTGARSVLSRRATSQQIVAALHAAAAGLVVTEAAPQRAAFQPVEALTPREIEVLRLLSEGESNKIVAYRLGISEHTVKFHVTSIMAKLGAGSRTEAVILGIRQGLILI